LVIPPKFSRISDRKFPFSRLFKEKWTQNNKTAKKFFNGLAVLCPKFINGIAIPEISVI
jgi:hypothetical protein